MSLLELPRDFPRRAQPSLRFGRVPLLIVDPVASALRQLCDSEGGTLLGGLLAAFAALLARYIGDAEIDIGVPFGGNLLPLRVNAAGDATVRELLRRTSNALLEAVAHPDGDVSPFSIILDVGAPAPPRPPAVDVWIHFEADRLDGWLAFDEALFQPATAARFAAHFANIIAHAVEAPDSTIESLRLETSEQILGDVAAWNKTERALPHASRLVHESIAEQARRIPDLIAVTASGVALTYAELERQSRALARLLRQQGAGPEVPVGVCARRSPAVVAAFLGTLRAGAAYVPLDPGYPPERLELMIADARVRTVLVEPGTRVTFPPHVRTIELTPEVFAGDGPLDVVVLPDNLAYIMYTSGSTGMPKGVMITHAAMRNTIAWMQDAYPLRAGDVIAHKTSISFTDSIWELLWPPLVGAQLTVIEENDTRFPRLLLQRLRQHCVAVTQFVPAQMRLFLDEVDRSGGPDPLPSLRWVFNGGEALPPSLARDWFRAFPRTHIANAYGMTESAIYGTNFVVEPADGEPIVLVGHPIANERAYVLDRDGQPCPPLCIGEIHVAGESLARGYLGRPDLTVERFVPDPFGPPGSRMYRTGDLGRQLPNGEISCLGRLDRQVKVRGGRVEMGEVEAALARHPAVRQAVVTARRDGADSQLAAYYTCRAADPGARELYRFLSSKLPSFMVPAFFIAVDTFPLTVNGKIDRDRLQSEAAAHN